MNDVERLVALALAEDLGASGDVTSAATIAPDTFASGLFAPRASGVLAGVEVAGAVFAAVDESVRFSALAADGDRVEPGQAVARVEGSAWSVLTAERTALNFLTHLSGVATLTARYVDEIAGTGAVIRDTRKTLPGLRRLQKQAVAAGGGVNHRAGLSDALLVKDNHVAAAGGVAEATRRALACANGLPVQIEVDSLEELEEALAAGARAVLLDNFSPNDLPAAVRRCRACQERVFVEASGGIGLAEAWAVAAAGVDAIAVGALTASAPALDIGLDFALER